MGWRKQTHLFERYILLEDSQFIEFTLHKGQVCRQLWIQAKPRGECQKNKYLKRRLEDPANRVSFLCVRERKGQCKLIVKTQLSLPKMRMRIKRMQETCSTAPEKMLWQKKIFLLTLKFLSYSRPDEIKSSGKFRFQGRKHGKSTGLDWALRGTDAQNSNSSAICWR